MSGIITEIKSSCNSPTVFQPWGTGISAGYWRQRADKKHGNPPQGNQELLVVKDKVG